MKIEVPDAARVYLGQFFAGIHRTQRKGLLHKTALISWLTRQVQDRLAEFEGWRLAPTLSQEDRLSLVRVIDYLKGQGKADREIEAWILMQRVRHEFPFEHTKVIHVRHKAV